MATPRALATAITMGVILTACAGGAVPTTAPATTSPPATATTQPAPPADTAPSTTTTTTTTTTSLPEIEPNGEVVEIAIDGFAFVPPEITISPGTTIVWTNLDGVGHTATAAGGSFNSGTLGLDATFETVAGAPGVYEYFCSIHPEMQATIIVEG